jgi:phospholipid/cholesterol/gamma-HCH transport system substrate-binding protein
MPPPFVISCRPVVKERTDNGVSAVGRVAAACALLLALGLVAYVVLGGSDSYRVRAQFKSASQLVKGNLVQIGGRKVGLVEEIELAPNGVAEVELEIEEDAAPLREGTRATIRMKSESSVAGRYVELEMPPGERQATIEDGGLIPLTDTQSQVDLDQFFGLFDEKTRKGLRNFFRGQGAAYAGRSEELADGFEYLNPSLAATRRLWSELTYDDRALESFLVSNAKLLTDIAERDEDVEKLVDRLAVTFNAIGREKESLSEAISVLPDFMRRSNTTFVNLRSTLDDLEGLVEESKPVTPKLRRALAALRPFARDAAPTFSDLANLVRRPGKENDLIELGESVPPFRDVTTRKVQRNGETRDGSFEAGTKSLRGQTPQWAFQRPYVVDFTGWFDDFSHSGIYDANGSASRVSTNVSAFAFVGGQLRFVPQDLRAQVFNEVAALGQANRCPGSTERPAEDKTNPYKPSDDFDCDPTQVPPGR